MWQRTSILALLALLITFSIPGQNVRSESLSLQKQINIPVVKFRLKNGLTVLLQEDHSVPMISYHTWFRVGSRHERPGITGIAHMFEHLMFKGTDRYKDGEFEKILQANGAENNAFTSHDYTGYYENLPSDKLELIMDIEADRMVNLKLTEEMFSAEREVVKEERRMRVDNSPSGTLDEVTYETMFKVHPYRWPVIGWMKDIESYKIPDFKEWYKTYYAPNNAVLVISGDLNVSKTKALVEKYYGSLKSQTIPSPTFAVEPVLKTTKIVTVFRPLQSSTVTLNFLCPPGKSTESLALDLVAEILGHGDSSRMHQKYVYNTQKATSVAAYNYSPLDQGLFTLMLNLKPGVDGLSMKTALFADIKKLRESGVTESELTKAKNQLLMSQVNTLKTVYGRAHVLASSEILFGDYKVAFDNIQKYADVTLAEVQAVILKYLDVQKASFMILRSKPSTPAQAQ